MQPSAASETAATGAGVAGGCSSSRSSGHQHKAAYRLILVRHGESTWNLANRFTGWTDVDLTAQGRRQAAIAGCLLRAHGFHLDLAFTSVLKRAIRTLHILEDVMDALHTPEVKSWRLNERHYGALQGLNKAEMAAKHGEEQVHIWRRSYATRPPALEPTDPRHPEYDSRYGDLDDNDLPATESLQDCVGRTLPFWNNDIAPAVSRGRRVIVAAHGNSLRGIIKHLDAISDKDIMLLEVPVGAPLVYELDEHLVPVRHYYLGQELVAAPPLDVTVLPPPALVEVGMTAAPGTASAVAEGEMELQALMQALVASGATTADHVHSAATAAALAGDLAEAEELMLRGALAAAKYVFGYVSSGAVAAAAAAAPALMAPAGPAAEELLGQDPSDVGAGRGRDTAELPYGVTGAWSGMSVFKRAAPLLDVERHVVVVVAAGPPAGVAVGPKVAASLAAELLAVLGVDKRVVLALAHGSGVAGGVEARGSPHIEGSMEVVNSLPAAWRSGGWVWSAGTAAGNEAEIVADALTCATGSVWAAQRAQI